MHLRSLAIFAGLLPAWFAQDLPAQAPVKPLTEAQVKDAKAIISEFKRNPRGPYGPIRWYCDDGRVLPPQGVPCAPGKGRQHAASSPQAKRLETMNLDVARFLATMPFETFLDRDRNYFWMREMVLLDYLGNRDDGWIYKTALLRRGVRQAEDEEKAARALLSTLLADPQWVEKNYGLVVQVATVAPHGLDTSRTRRIRALSASLADQDSRFTALRSKIHSKPGPEDAGSVRDFVAASKPANKAGFEELIALLQAEYVQPDFGKSAARLRALLKGTSMEASAAAATQALERGPEEAFLRGAELALDLRKALLAPGGARKLEILDANLWLLDQAFRYGVRSGVMPGTRRAHVEHLRAWLRLATAAGLLAPRQLQALEAGIVPLLAKEEVSAETYHEAVRYLARSLEWTRAAATREFGPVIRHYAPVEPVSNGLLDDLLRRSVVLHLSREVEFLLNDADRAIGRRHDVLGKPVSRGVSALNPGIAIAEIEIVDPGEEGSVVYNPSKIYVIPETVADIKPVAGILTLDSGNALSHAQLLAAGLGIPNAAVPSSLLPDLRALRGERVFYAVTSGGAVVLRRWSTMTEAEKKTWAEQPQKSRGRVKLDTSRLDLRDTGLRKLSDVDKSDSGRIAGPKAANLGQLAKYFPDRIVPGIVIPFGVFYQYIAGIRSGPGALDAEIRDVYERAEKMRQSGASTEEVRGFVYPKLARFRQLIQNSPLPPRFEADLRARMKEVFGADGSYGVFVRSDTNAEDLPEFSGAGLNLTVPNVVGESKILAALKEVWASPFRERAYDWRSQALDTSAYVLPSVLLLRTVAADKSGVLVTVDLDDLNPDEITVNVNEGVAAVVDGGVAESLLLRPDGSVQLLAQARSPYRRIALPSGGFAEIPTSGSDTVLLPDEITQLRQLVREVKQKYPPSRDDQGRALPWDIEFGFEKGQLRLFQIRPLVRFRAVETLQALAHLEDAKPAQRTVRMDAEVTR